MDHRQKIVDYISTHSKDFLEKRANIIKQNASVALIKSRGIRSRAQQNKIRKYMLQQPPKKYRIFSPEHIE